MEHNTHTHSFAKNQIAEFIYPLFWEYEPQTLDVVKHADVIIARIMERGGWAAMCWLRQTYSQDRLISFLKTRGKQILPPRELNYWALICGIPAEKRQNWLKQAKGKSYVWGTRYSH